MLSLLIPEKRLTKPKESPHLVVTEEGVVEEVAEVAEEEVEEEAAVEEAGLPEEEVDGEEEEEEEEVDTSEAVLDTPADKETHPQQLCLLPTCHSAWMTMV